MKAKDVMTVHVVSVSPETSIADIAELLINRSISAVPVIESDGKLVGIVSEGDLLHRVETGTQKHHRSWWLSLLAPGETAAMDYVKSHGKCAADVMTRDVVTVEEETPLTEIAEILEKRRIKRVPVIRNGALLGIVSRANLIQGLATLRGAVPVTRSDDATIRQNILAEVNKEKMWSNLSATNVTVTNGVVELWGFVDSDLERRAWRIAVESVPGVTRLVDHRSVRPVAGGAY